jgi:hypothetical protein
MEFKLYVVRRAQIYIYLYSFVGRHAVGGSYTIKKVINFHVPGRDVATKLSLNLIIPGQEEFGY